MNETTATEVSGTATEVAEVQHHPTITKWVANVAKVCSILWHPFSVLLSKLKTWVKSLLTVRDIFFLSIGFTLCGVVSLIGYNKLMKSFILLGKILHDGRIFELTEVIAK